MKTWSNDRAQKYPRLYQWSAVFGGLDFSRSLFLIYFASLGFSGTQSGVLQATLFWSSFLLELPSGIFADKYGRKKSISIGMAGLVATFVVLATAKTFAAAILGFVLWGGSFAFISGAGSALLYDGLKESGRLDSHLGWLSKIRSLGTLSMGASIVAGGFMYEMLPVSVFWASAAAAAIGFTLIWPVPEPKVHESAAQQPGTIKSLRLFFNHSKGRDLLVFLGGMAAIEMAITPFFIFSQSLFHSQGLSEKSVSVILGGGFLISAIAQAAAVRAKNFSLMTMVTFIGLTVMLGLGSLALGPALPLQVFIFVIVNTLPLFLFVHTDQYIQDACDSHIRASLLSVQSFVNAVFIGISYLSIGMVSDKIGMMKTLACLGLPALAGIALIYLHFARIRRRSR
jgi:MFS family permease